MSGQLHGRPQHGSADSTGIEHAARVASFAGRQQGSQPIPDPPLTGGSVSDTDTPAIHHPFQHARPDFPPMYFVAPLDTIAPGFPIPSSTGSGTPAGQSSTWSGSGFNGIASGSATTATDPVSLFGGSHAFPQMPWQKDAGVSHFQTLCYPQNDAAPSGGDSQHPINPNLSPLVPDIPESNKERFKRSLDESNEADLIEYENMIRQRRQAIQSQTFTAPAPYPVAATATLGQQRPLATAPAITSSAEHGAIAAVAASAGPITSFAFTRSNNYDYHRQIQGIVDNKIREAHDSCDTRRCGNTESQSPAGSTKYECIWNCGCMFKRKWEWQRHLQNREPQSAWVCFLCCQNGEAAPYVNFREDKFFEHLGTRKHSIPKTDTDALHDLANKSQWLIQPLERRRCGYGSHITRSWPEWLSHLEAHYTGKGGVRKIEPGEVYYTDEQRQDDDRVCCRDDNHLPQRVALATRSSTRPGKSGKTLNNSSRPGLKAKGSSGSGETSKKGPQSTYQTYHQSYEMLVFKSPTSHVRIRLTIAELWRGLERRESLGNGAFCRVEKVSHSKIGDFALKSHNVQKSNSAPSQHIEREVKILSSLNHPNVVRMVSATRESSQHSILMWPAAHTDLDRYLSNPKSHSLAPQDIIGGLTGLACGLHYMHSRSVTHNNIKPENILLNHASFLFADFGAAVTKGEHGARCRCPPSAQTLIYQAPEVRSGIYEADKADIFSLGLIFTQLLLLLAYGPQSDLSTPQTNVLSADRQPRTWIPRFQALKRGMHRLGGVVGQISGRLYRLCHAMTQSSSENRPTAAAVVADLSQTLHLLPKAFLGHNESLPFHFTVTRLKSTKRNRRDSSTLNLMRPGNNPLQRGVTVYWHMISQNTAQSALDCKSKRPRLMSVSQPLGVDRPISHDLSTSPPRLLLLSGSDRQAMCKVIERDDPGWPQEPPRYFAFTDQTSLTSGALSKDPNALRDWTRISSLPHTLHFAIATSIACGVQYVWLDWLAGLNDPVLDFDDMVQPEIKNAAFFTSASFAPMSKEAEQAHNNWRWETVCPLSDFNKRYDTWHTTSQQRAPPGTRLSRAIVLNELRKKCPDCARHGLCRLSSSPHYCDLIEHDTTPPYQSPDIYANHELPFHYSCTNDSRSTLNSHTTNDHNAPYDTCHDDAIHDEAPYEDIQLRDLLGLDPLRGVWTVGRTNIDSSWWDVDSVASLKEFTESSFETF